MKVFLGNTKIHFSDKLAIQEKLKKNDPIFIFKIKDENLFGFHKADEEQAKYMICPRIKEDKDTGRLYIQPMDPPVGLIKATMRLSYARYRALEVEKKDVKETYIYIIQKP